MEQQRELELMLKRVTQSYLSLNGFASHHQESYEYFVHAQLWEIIFEQNPIDIHCPKQGVIHRVVFQDMHIQKPTIKEASGFIAELSPREAQLRKQTYCADIFINVIHKVYKGPVLKKEDKGKKTKYSLISHRCYKNIKYFQLPAMQKSTVCHDEHDLTDSVEGGTFLINGYKKCIVTQEKLKTVRPM